MLNINWTQFFPNCIQFTFNIYVDIIQLYIQLYHTISKGNIWFLIKKIMILNMFFKPLWHYCIM